MKKAVAVKKGSKYYAVIYGMEFEIEIPGEKTVKSVKKSVKKTKKE